MLLAKSIPCDCEISHWGGTAARKGKRGTSLQRPGAPPGITGGGGGNGDSPEGNNNNNNNRGPPGGNNPGRGSDDGDGDPGSGGPGDMAMDVQLETGFSMN
ncbi:uncharacterized protein JN550_004702 [Neoarthrinium moseri]|uniref:uncharacterized protein n=1 Tax=Neoarthrinium moseri TaxID=1658444 RepID=UPI001FDB53EE|nr:uncharacterized protein JN550_004702 [Neoarthrinium moseri]KAI1871257.1 hypothetical protein JN550_004702 [Neoarthrinium moseri]